MTWTVDTDWHEKKEAVINTYGKCSDCIVGCGFKDEVEGCGDWRG